MKRSTLEKRLEKYTGAKNSVAYKMAKELITGEKNTYKVYGNLIRPVHTSGSGRFTQNLDYTEKCLEILTFLKLKFEVGNDAPRGGLTGNYIKILTKIV